MDTESFVCKRCGNCCRVPGYVHLRDGDTVALAEYLGLAVGDFTTAYTRLTADRRGISLVENPDHSCVFLTAEGECLVNGAKPEQCREFPDGWHFEGYERICRGAHVQHSAGGENRGSEGGRDDAP